MAVFSYKAADAAGKIVEGTLEAVERRGVAAALQKMGYVPIHIRDAGGRRKGMGFDLRKDLSGFLSRTTAKDVMAFTQDLSSLLEAGLPVDRALAILIGVTEKEKFRKIVQAVLKSVQGGGYLSDALAKHPKAFSTFYVNMVRAGETGGVLESVLSRLGLFLESSQDLRDYLKSALVYPLFLVVVGGASIIILLTFVIPKFSLIFADLGQAIPMSTQILLAISGFVRSYWWAMLGLIGIGVYFLRRYAKTPEGRLKLDEGKMKLPVFGDLIRKIEVARFARTLGTLTRSGVPILQALRLVKDIIVNQVVSRSMVGIFERVKEGERLSKPLEETGVFPSMAIQMITVGEETGKLDEMLLKVAENYEKIVKGMVKRFISFLEPAMILVMGVLIGFIVISMLMAIFSINEMPF